MACLAVQSEFGRFGIYVWQFIGGKPIQNRHRPLKEIRTHTPESTAISNDLLRRGFKFVGSTIWYAFM
jgi:DNA-3-methyladenine glycosylase I